MRSQSKNPPMTINAIGHDFSNQSRCSNPKFPISSNAPIPINMNAPIGFRPGPSNRLGGSGSPSVRAFANAATKATVLWPGNIVNANPTAAIPSVLNESRGYLEYYGQLCEAALPDWELFDVRNDPLLTQSGTAVSWSVTSFAW